MFLVEEITIPSLKGSAANTCFFFFCTYCKTLMLLIKRLFFEKLAALFQATKYTDFVSFPIQYLLKKFYTEHRNISLVPKNTITKQTLLLQLV